MTYLTACRLIACSLITFVAMTTVYSSEMEQQETPWTVTELMRSMAQVRHSKATFVERKHFSMLKEPLVFAGQLLYTAPGRLEKYTSVPKPESMVLDQDKLTMQSGDNGKPRVVSLREYPAIWAFVESIRSTLAGDFETLNRFYKVSMEGNDKKWRLILLPLDSKMKSLVDEIRITGSNEQINTIEVMEAGGDHSMMEITRDDS